MDKGILVPIDFSDVTDAVLEESKRLARALAAKLWLIHVASPRPEFVGYEVGPVYTRDSMAEQLREEHALLGAHRKRLCAEGLEVTAMLVPGIPSSKIISEAEKFRPLMIVMGSHGHGALMHLLTGSVCETVLRQAACPVLVVPSRVAEKTSRSE